MPAPAAEEEQQHEAWSMAGATVELEGERCWDGQLRQTKARQVDDLVE